MEIKPWNELLNYQTPDWMRDGKFGIYTHWGPYAVPAYGENVSWYGSLIYREGEIADYHRRTYGSTDQFGYKDFIPMFTAEKFDAEEWAELFKKAGATFAGPVAEHHDGFSMWNSRCNPCNAAKMGPKRDVVGELEKAIRGQNMKFMTSMHHGLNWCFFPDRIKRFAPDDPRYSPIYGKPHAGGQEREYPTAEFLETWYEKLQEVIDGYHPDYIWLEGDVKMIREEYQRRFLTYYHEQADQRHQPIAISYKDHDLPFGAGMLDVEQGRFSEATYHDWITDTTIDTASCWGYNSTTGYKSAKTMIHYLIDNVSKNGYLLLNVGPKPDGTIPEEARRTLLGMGEWLKQYGEAVYGTRPWRVSEEGPHKLTLSGTCGDLHDQVQFTAEDMRFTIKDQYLYVICLGAPGDRVCIKKFCEEICYPMYTFDLYPEEIVRITALGSEEPLPYQWKGWELEIDSSKAPKNEIATVFRIERRS